MKFKSSLRQFLAVGLLREWPVAEQGLQILALHNPDLCSLVSASFRGGLDVRATCHKNRVYENFLSLIGPETSALFQPASAEVPWISGPPITEQGLRNILLSN